MPRRPDRVAQPGGTELAPDSLRHAGVGDGPPLIDLGDTRSRLRDPVRDHHETGVVAGEDVVGLTAELRERIAGRPEPQTPLLVLGGCARCCLACSAVCATTVTTSPWCTLDGHVDLYDGRTSPTGEAADMPLAVPAGSRTEPWLGGLPAGPTAANRHHLARSARRGRGSCQRIGAAVRPSRLQETSMPHTPSSPTVTMLATAIAEDLTCRHGGGFWARRSDVLDESAFPQPIT